MATQRSFSAAQTHTRRWPVGARDIQRPYPMRVISSPMGRTNAVRWRLPKKGLCRSTKRRVDAAAWRKEPGVGSRRALV